MKNLVLVTVVELALGIGSAAHAGYHFDIDQTKILCLSKIHPSSAEALQLVTKSIIANLHAACEEYPNTSGGHSTLKSVEIQDEGACGFGQHRYEFHVTASCYLP